MIVYLRYSNESYDEVKQLIEEFLADVKNDIMELHLEFTSWEEIDIRKIVSELSNNSLDEFYLEPSESQLGDRTCISYTCNIHTRNRLYSYTSIPNDGNYHERIVWIELY